MTEPKIVDKRKTKSREDKPKGKVRPEAEGLCTTCNNEPDCVHSKSGGPVLQCEEFDSYQEPKGVIEHIPREKDGNGNGNGKDAGKYKGLCMNCDHRETCVNANLEGGVWHCEEYQ